MENSLPAKHDALVVIVAYSSTPGPFELASFRQCLKVFAGREICLVCPEGLDYSPYTDFCAEPAPTAQAQLLAQQACAQQPQIGPRLRVERFPNSCFDGVAAYNRLVLSPEFYERFSDAEYILLYQLDAWVFEDRLTHWCSLGYDYIGAPWFTDRREMLPIAGNGGFTLRRVRSCLDLLTGRQKRKWRYGFFLQPFPARTALRRVVKRCLHLAEMLLCRVSPRHYLRGYARNEDYAFVKAMSAIEPYRVAPPEEAMHFSFERFPEHLYKRTGGLPFGAHALARYAPEFWAEHLPPDAALCLLPGALPLLPQSVSPLLPQGLPQGLPQRPSQKLPQDAPGRADSDQQGGVR